MGNSIFTGNIKLLQSKYGFETFIRHESQKALKLIKELDVIEDIAKIIEFEGNDSMTNAKKLMKIKNSPVLKMKKKNLINKLKTIPKYAKKVKIKNGKIQISSKKDVLELLKVLNDDYHNNSSTLQTPKLCLSRLIKVSGNILSHLRLKLVLPKYASKLATGSTTYSESSGLLTIQ